MTAALVAMGSNISPRRATLRSAVRSLATLEGVQLVATSAFRETQAVETPPQSGPFINAACLLRTDLSALELLHLLQHIEADAGRERLVRNGPRTLDLDLVLFGETVSATAELELPHPRCHERPFVLEPCADIAPQMRHPVLGLSMAELRDSLSHTRAASDT